MLTKSAFKNNFSVGVQSEPNPIRRRDVGTQMAENDFPGREHEGSNGPGDDPEPRNNCGSQRRPRSRRWRVPGGWRGIILAVTVAVVCLICVIAV